MSSFILSFFFVSVRYKGKERDKIGRVYSRRKLKKKGADSFGC